MKSPGKVQERREEIQVRGGVRVAGRPLGICWHEEPGDQVRKEGGSRARVVGGSHPLMVRARAALCFPVGVEKLKKEGAHPDGGESQRARAWCGDAGPGWRGGATSYCAVW